MNIELQGEQDGLRTLRMVGDFNIYHAADTRQALLPLLADAGTVEVDLSGVAEIDSSGVQLLIAAKKHLEARGASLHLVRHSAAVIDALELFDLDGYFGDPMLIPPSGQSGAGRGGHA